MISTKNKIKKFFLLLSFSTMSFKSSCKFQDYDYEISLPSGTYLNIEKKILDKDIRKLMDKNTYHKNSEHIGVLVHVAIALIQVYYVTDHPASLAYSTLNLVDYVCSLKNPYKDFLSDVVGGCFYPFFAEDGSFDLFIGVPWDHPLRIIPSLKKIACKLKEIGLLENEAQQIYLKMYYNLPENITKSEITDDLYPLEMNNNKDRYTIYI